VDHQDGVGPAVAEVAPGGQLGLLLGGQSGPAVGPDEQPGGARARRRAAGVAEDRGSVQRGVDPEGTADQPGDSQQDNDD
jgi:hypothetical protein